MRRARTAGRLRPGISYFSEIRPKSEGDDSIFNSLKMTFISEDFLLDTPEARTLYHEYAAGLPILDYHNHLDPERIAGNHPFQNLTEAWLRHDHYKWRAMRALGVDERLISGDAGPREKFEAWAGCVPYLVRNPLYHWTHLELQRYFGIGELLSKGTARRIYAEANAQLQDPDHTPRQLLTRMRVTLIQVIVDDAGIV